MNSINKKTNPFILFFPFVVFFALGTFYLYRFTGYLFYSQEKASLFMLGSTYLLEHLTQPGGFLKYLANLQTTFYYYPLAGALLKTFEICGIIFLLSRIGSVLTGRRFYFLPFLIGAALYYLQINFQYQAANNLGIFIGLLLFLLAVNGRKNKKEWAFVILFPLIYFLLGGLSFVFLGLISIYFSYQKKWYKLLVIWLLGAVFFFVGKEFLFMQAVEVLTTYPFSVTGTGGQERLFLLVLGVLLLFPVFIHFEIKKVSSFSVKKIRLIELTPLVVILVLAFTLVPRIDKKAINYFYVEKLFSEQKYDEIVQFNYQVATDNMLTSFLNNIALAEKGHLTDVLFNYRQSRDGRTLLLNWDNSIQILQHGRYFFYTIGMINETQRWTYESVMMEGYSPEGLKMLIKTDLIKGKYKVAEKYISMLEKSIFYTKEAKHFRSLLFNDKAIANHKELGQKKLLDTKQDFFVHANSPASNLDQVIAADSTNIPAIEYKLAWLMLRQDMKGVINMLPIMEKAGYNKIPKNVEELVVAYQLSKMGELPELKRLKINPGTKQRFDQFFRIYQKYGRNKKQAQRELANHFADTYWYFAFFG